MKMHKMNARAVTTFASMVAALAGCSAEPIAAPSDGTLSAEQSLTVIDPNGASLAVTLLPGSTANTRGDARYFVRALDRELEVSRVAGSEGSDFVEVLERRVVLGSVVLGTDSVSLRTPDGRSLYSATGTLPAAEAMALVEPVALALLDERSIDAFDAALSAEAGGQERIGVSRQSLRLRLGVGGTCPGASCTNSVAPTVQTCCCKVGDRCVSTVNTCYCEAATKVVAF